MINYHLPLRKDVEYTIKCPNPIALGLIRIRNCNHIFNQFQVIGPSKSYNLLPWSPDLLTIHYGKVVNLFIDNGWLNGSHLSLIGDKNEINYAISLISKNSNGYKIGIWNTSLNIDMTPHPILTLDEALDRASMVDIGIYLNIPQEAIYAFTSIADDQRILNGSHSYSIIFTTLPPLLSKGFWSLTLYNSSTKLPVKFSNDIQSVNSSSFRGNSIYINGLDNSLYVDDDSTFYIILRIYLPNLSELTDDNFPTIRLI
jgi:hypothetical protein